MTDTLEQTISCNEAATAVDVLALATGLSKSKVKSAMTAGAVWIQKGSKTVRLRRAKSMLQSGEQISIHYSDKILSDTPIAPALIVDNKNYSVWNKPVGLMSSGTRFGDHCAINRVVQKMLDRPVFLVHRLDKFVKGVMVLAHSKRCAAALSKQFQDRTIKKIYKAIVTGKLDSPVQITESLDGKDANTRIAAIDHDDRYTLLQVEILTGRKHQIRRHLAGIGLPILGDRQYSDSRFPQLQLASISLAFDCPNLGERVTFHLPTENHPRLSYLRVTPD
jgi:tRNA pseudouridine32 synthase/23S rRNA pseudouridine746 synthase